MGSSDDRQALKEESLSVRSPVVARGVSPTQSAVQSSQTSDHEVMMRAPTSLAMGPQESTMTA